MNSWLCHQRNATGALLDMSSLARHPDDQLFLTLQRNLASRWAAQHLISPSLIDMTSSNIAGGDGQFST